MLDCIFFVLFHQRCTCVKLKQPIYLYVSVYTCISTYIANNFRNKLAFPLSPSTQSDVSLSVYLRSPLYIYPQVSVRYICLQAVQYLYLSSPGFFYITILHLSFKSSAYSEFVFCYLTCSQYLLLSNNITCISLIKHVSHIFQKIYFRSRQLMMPPCTSALFYYRSSLIRCTNCRWMG